MKLTHVFSGDDGMSHFAERVLPGSVSALGSTSEDIECTTAAFRNTEGGSTSTEFRPAPRRQLVILLQGRVEYECGHGERREFGVGDVILFDDTTGEGHRARVLDEPRLQVFIRVPADVDVESWATTEESGS